MRGLVAFTPDHKRALIIPTADGMAALPEYEDLAEAEEVAVMKANAEAGNGFWQEARATLETAGFAVNNR